MNRRKFLGWLGVGGTAAALPAPLLAPPADPLPAAEPEPEYDVEVISGGGRFGTMNFDGGDFGRGSGTTYVVRRRQVAPRSR